MRLDGLPVSMHVASLLGVESVPLVCIIIAAACSVLISYVVKQRSICSNSTRRWPHGVEVRQSLLPGAGEGLFATRRFAEGELLGEYFGNVLTLAQAYALKLTERSYLMGGFGLNAHVDARYAFDAPGRYVNDNFDASKLNARFEKLKPQRRALVIATRKIDAGEEIFCSYGESYWTARGIDHRTGGPLALRSPASAQVHQITPQHDRLSIDSIVN